jgi:hypothetical protein
MRIIAKIKLAMCGSIDGVRMALGSRCLLFGVQF